MSSSDGESGHALKEDIAHQFLLPERQAKVNQLVRNLSVDETATKYCICQSTDGSRFMIGCDKCNEWYHGDCINVTKRDAKDIKRFYCHLCREKEPNLQIRYKRHRHTKTDLVYVDDTDVRTNRSQGGKKSSRRCGQCTACHRTEDCRRCDFCKDMKKFGGSNRIRQKCRLRQCLNFGIVSGQFSTPSDSQEPLVKASVKHPIKENIKRSSPCKKKVAQSSSERHSSQKPKHHKYRRKSPDFRSPVNDDDDVYEDEKKDENLSNTKFLYRSQRSKRDLADDGDLERDMSRQCYGPACIEPARVRSKYCSDECGLKLAKSRLMELVPPKIQQWQSSPCVAEENNKKQLEQIRRKQQEARSRLQDLDSRHRDLDALVERGKAFSVDPDIELTETEDEGELSMYCVTCGLEISQKGALRHLEKCFTKHELQTSFGSIYKTRIEGSSMFCDFYNPHNKTYCKRLKALCPEHSKEPKSRPDEICGYPLVSDMFTLTGELCHLPKRKCTKHHCWEKLRRAEIDSQRVTQWLRLDELYEQERNIRIAMSNRMGVLGLMLHQTIDHDPINPIVLPSAVKS